MTAGELGFYIGGYLVDACVVALSPCQNGLGNGNNVLAADFYVFLFKTVAEGVGEYLSQIVALTDDGRSDAPRNGTDCSFHAYISVPKNEWVFQLDYYTTSFCIFQEIFSIK